MARASCNRRRSVDTFVRPQVRSCSTPPVGASRAASIERTCAAIKRLLLVWAQRPVALARPTMPGAHRITAPDAQRDDNGPGRTAEDAPAWNDRPHLHLFAITPFRCCCTTNLVPRREDTPVRVPTAVAEKAPPLKGHDSPFERMAAISQGADQRGDRGR
jgi:hypothetical protein